MESPRLIGVADLSPWREGLTEAMAGDTGGKGYEDLVAGVESGDLRAIAVGTEAVVVMSLETEPNRHLHLWAITGRDMDKWLAPLQAGLVRIAKEVGAERITCGGRIGWQKALRKLGWQVVSTTMALGVEHG